MVININLTRFGCNKFVSISRLPDFIIRGKEQELIVNGRSEERIPFTELITLWSSPAGGPGGILIETFWLRLIDDTDIKMGSISGEKYKVAPKTQRIIAFLEIVINIQAETPN